MRISALLGIGTILLGTAGAFAARPHEEARVQEPARIVQPVQEYRGDSRPERDMRDIRFERHDSDRDFRDENRDFRDEHRDRDGRWNVVVQPVVVNRDCR